MICLVLKTEGAPDVSRFNEESLVSNGQSNGTLPRRAAAECL